MADVARGPRVAVIGCGMAGLLSAWLLVSAHGVPAADVQIFEKRRSRWKLPRAAGCGDDSRRLLLASLPRAEIDPALQEIVRDGFHYAWRDANLEVIYESKLGEIGLSGWPMIVGMNQPVRRA